MFNVGNYVRAGAAIRMYACTIRARVSRSVRTTRFPSRPRRLCANAENVLMKIN